MPWRGPEYEGEFPSLGPVVAAWIEHYLCHGPGDVQGEPIELDDELYAFIVRAYRLDPESGSRVYRRAFLSRAKGRAKSEMAGMLAMAELLGPVRFDGWDGQGEPVGRPVTSPYVRCLATEEGQSGNTFHNVAVMAEHVKETHGGEFPGLDFGRSALSSSRIFQHGGGQIVPSTASGASKDGGRETFAVMDEALSVDTPLPTPSGWTTMGAVTVGDQLLGSDGRPTSVVKTTDVMNDRPCYRVTFEDYTTVVASEGHLWHTKLARSQALPKVRSTGDMFTDGRRFRVPAAYPWQLSTAQLSIEPYVLGVWLGDGDRSNATITGAPVDLAEMSSWIEYYGYTTEPCQVSDGYAPKIYVSLPGSHRGRFSPVDGLKTRLRDIGLLNNKGVPPEYLRGSVEQRTDLLRGLMDTDGSVEPGGACTFANADPLLIAGVVELLYTLGEQPSVYWQRDSRARRGWTGRVHFTPRHVAPFNLKRKADCVRGHRRGKDWVTVRSIEPVPSMPVRCVGVDAADHLFLAGESAKVTHNTHLFTTPELHRMHATVRRNLRKRLKAEPWSLETSTMYAPGEDSVAEATHGYAQAIAEGRTRDPGLLFDHRQASANTDLARRDSLRTGLREAYGPFAEHMDLDGIIGEIWDPQSDPNESRRYWLNQPTAASDAWLTPGQVQAVATAEEVVADGEPITLGFDGSRKREHRVTDSTALVGCRLSDGHLFLLPFGDGLSCWEQPSGPEGADWEVPTEQVDEAVQWAFERYRVIGFYADPARWESYIDRWTADYGPKLLTRASRRQPIQWWITGGRAAQVVEATERLHAAIVDGQCSLDAAAAPLARHLSNARRRVSSRGVQIAKDHPTSERKIDAAVAAILAWRARSDAITAGYGQVGNTKHRVRRAVGF